MIVSLVNFSFTLGPIRTFLNLVIIFILHICKSALKIPFGMLINVLLLLLLTVVMSFDIRRYLKRPSSTNDERQHEAKSPTIQIESSGLSETQDPEPEEYGDNVVQSTETNENSGDNPVDGELS